MVLGALTASVCSSLKNLITPNFYMQVRNKNIWINKWMVRDVKRRKLVKEHGPMKLRLLALYRSNILPKELLDLAGKELAALPRDAHFTRTVDRCVLTSKPRGVLRRWRMNRIIWRLMADYNKMSGVTRAWW